MNWTEAYLLADMEAEEMMRAEMTDSEMLALIRALLPDTYSESKDWRTGNVTERIICLKAWLESKTEEVDWLIDILNDNRIEAQAAEIERLRGDVEKRRETRMSDDDLIRRGDALYAIAGWEIPSTAISALPAVTQPAPDTAADRIEAQAAEIERLLGDLAKAVDALEAIYEITVEPAETDHKNVRGWIEVTARNTLSVLTGAKP